MTVMIPEFFGLPHSVVRVGKLKELNGTAVSLLVALWHESERTCTRELTRTDKQLMGLFKAHRNSIGAARRELEKVGLVIAEPFGSKGFVYQLCDPETGKPWPGSPNAQIKYVKKYSNSGAEQGPPTRRQSITISNSELAGVSFPFGANAPQRQGLEKNLNSSASMSGLPWNEIGRH